MSLETQKLAAAAGADIGRLERCVAALEARPSGTGGAGITVQVHDIANYSRRSATAVIDITPALRGQTCLILAEDRGYGHTGTVNAATAVLSDRLEYPVSGSEQFRLSIIGPVAAVETKSTIDGGYTPPELDTY